MDILVVNWRDMGHPQAGGAEQYLHEQALVWVAGGHRVTWICGRGIGQQREETVSGITYLRGGGTYSVYPLAWWRYLRLKHRPDVIIDSENGIPFFMKLISRAPVVLVIHHVHTHVWRQECSPLVALLGRWLEGWLMPRVYRNCQIVTVSESSAEMIRALFSRRNAKNVSPSAVENSPRLSIIYNAVNSELYPGDKSETPELLFVGRLKRYKSIDTLLHVMSRLKDTACRLNIVGQGDDEPRLKALARELNLENVTFLGYVTADEKRRLLQRAWIFMNPSSMEGWGVTNIEANACGTPVLGADVFGIRDSVQEGKSGWLVPHGNVDAFESRVRAVLDDPESLQPISKSCLEWAENFSWKASAQAFMRLLQAGPASGG